MTFYTLKALYGTTRHDYLPWGPYTDGCLSWGPYTDHSFLLSVDLLRCLAFGCSGLDLAGNRSQQPHLRRAAALVSPGRHGGGLGTGLRQSLEDERNFIGRRPHDRRCAGAHANVHHGLQRAEHASPLLVATGFRQYQVGFGQLASQRQRVRRYDRDIRWT